jgi:hypothetical protein
MKAKYCHIIFSHLDHTSTIALFMDYDADTEGDMRTVGAKVRP